MALVINATEENVTIQVAGNYFNWKPGQEKTIRDERIANFITTDRRGCGLAVLPDVLSAAEDAGDVEVTAEELAERHAARNATKKEAMALALRDYINHKREIIKNNQVSLARDLARADYKYGPEHEMSDGEFLAMELVAKYDAKGKDQAQEKLDRIEKLKKQIASK